MAKTTLSTGYKNDVMADTMNNRRRYNMIHNSDGTVSFVDVTVYDQVGSDFGAVDINAITSAVNQCVDIEVVGNLSSLTTSQKNNLVAAINSLKSATDVSNVASLRGPSFATLKEFVLATNKNNLVPNLLRFKDTGGWGPKGSNWYRCIVLYQNPYNTEFDIDGNALFLTSTNELYLGHITGTQSVNNLAITYKRVMLNADFLDTTSAIKANTSTGKGAGALAVKGIYNEFKNELTANNKQFYFDYQNGKYGFNTDPNRGADTFSPFNQTDGYIPVMTISPNDEHVPGGFRILQNENSITYFLTAVGSGGKQYQHIFRFEESFFKKFQYLTATRITTYSSNKAQIVYDQVANDIPTTSGYKFTRLSEISDLYFRLVSTAYSAICYVIVEFFY